MSDSTPHLISDNAAGAGASGLLTPACSDWARSQQLDPVGTAGHYQGFLLVEQPLPWPADISQIPELAEVAGIAESANLRLQAVVNVTGAPGPDGRGISQRSDGGPTGAGRAGPRRIICYRSSSGGDESAGPLVRSEGLAAVDVLASVDALAEVASALVSGAPGAEVEGPGTGGSSVIDVLVCTHGRRDMCCGGSGMDLVSAVMNQPIVMPGATVRLWRTSHTGGHRFAPTFVVLPSATLWAWADPLLVRRVVMQEGPIGDVLDRYRGNACLGTPAQQALERAVLAETGWSLLRSPRRATHLGDDQERLETEEAGTWEATVREGRRVPQPECRSDPGAATKFGTEWVVEELRQVVPA
jgi:hypothetical protein